MKTALMLLAATTLALSGCSDCGASKAPQEGESIKSEPETVGSSVVDTSTPEPGVDAAQPAVTKPTSQARNAPSKQLKIAPIQKCASGGCDFECDMNTRCLLACAGGNCTQACNSDSSCTATCDGGGCTQHCRQAAGCTFTCKGGGCDQRCHPLSACSTTCRGGKCTGCRGPTCKLGP